MIIATHSGAIHADHESVTEFDRVVRELAKMFALNGWTWSGDAPNIHAIEWRLMDIVGYAVESAAKSDDGYGCVSGGRLFVEARRGGTGTDDDDAAYALMIGVKVTL